MRRRLAVLLLAVPCGVLWAQPVVAPTPSDPATSERNTAGYTVSQSFELGYRFRSVDGNSDRYRSDVNFGNGIRLLGSSLSLHSLEGHGKLFDELTLTTQGLGNDPYQSSTLRLQHNKFYRYNLAWRLNDYVNPGLIGVYGNHAMNTRRQWQDHDITLFPSLPIQFIGGVSRNTPPGWCDAVLKFLNEVVVNIAEVETLLTRNKIWVDRTKDVGVISKEEAIDFGLSGPNLRGCGVDYDLRKAQPYLCYKDLQFDVPLGSVGDCYDRYLVRMEEMRQSVRLVHQCLDKLPGGFENKSKEPVNVADGKIVLPPKNKVMSSMEELIHQFMLVTQGMNCPPGEVYFGHENPKGELGFYINSRGGGTPYRMKIRSPSFVNLSILSHLLPGHMMSDTVSILGSFDFVMGECDR